MKSVKEIEIRVRRRVVVAEDEEVYKTQALGPEAVVRVAASLLETTDQECFLVFLLDVKKRVIGYQEIHRGTFEGCPVDPRLVFRAACIQGAASVAVVHNHPSGDPEPSPADATLTKRLVAAGELLGCPVLDHLVIGADGAYYSFAEHGRL